MLVDDGGGFVVVVGFVANVWIDEIVELLDAMDIDDDVELLRTGDDRE